MADGVTPVYARPSDLVTSQATITVAAGGVSSDTNYGLAKLADGNVRTVTLFSGGAVTLLFDWGSAQRLDALALPHSNLDASLNVRVQLNATDSWASPTIDRPLTRDADDIDGHRPSPWIDFTTVSGYTTTGFRYGRLVIPAGNPTPVKLGEVVWIERLRTFENGLQFGQRGVVRKFIEAVETEAASVIAYRRRIKQRVYLSRTKASDDDFQALQTLADDCGGRARAFFFAPDRTKQTNDGMLALLSPLTARALMGDEEWFDVTSVPVQVEEQSRGLPLV